LARREFARIGYRASSMTARQKAKAPAGPEASSANRRGYAGANVRRVAPSKYGDGMRKER